MIHKLYDVTFKYIRLLKNCIECACLSYSTILFCVSYACYVYWPSSALFSFDSFNLHYHDYWIVQVGLLVYIIYCQKIILKKSVFSDCYYENNMNYFLSYKKKYECFLFSVDNCSSSPDRWGKREAARKHEEAGRLSRGHNSSAAWREKIRSQYE